MKSFGEILGRAIDALFMDSEDLGLNEPAIEQGRQTTPWFMAGAVAEGGSWVGPLDAGQHKQTPLSLAG